jgi:uncharacterized protein
MRKARAYLFKWALVSLAIVAAASLSSCDTVMSLFGGGSTTKEPTLTVTPSYGNIIVGGMKKFTVSAKTSSGSQDGWYASSDNDSIAEVTDQTQYNFTVTARAFGQTSISVVSDSGKMKSVQVAVSGSVSGPPEVPTDLMVGSTSSYSINFTWGQSGDASSWDVQQSTDGNNFMQIAFNLASPTYTAIQLTPNTTYYFQVRARNSNGNSGWSVSMQGRTTVEGGGTSTNPVTESPTVFMGQVGSSNIEIKWYSIANAKYYEVARTSNGTTMTVASGYTNLSFTDTGLYSETTYSYQVRGGNDLPSTGPWSSWLPITTAASQSGITAPTAPTISVTGFDPISVTIGWSAVNGASAYTIYTSVDQVNWNNYTTVYNPATSFTIPNLQTGMTYFFKIQAWNNAGTSPDSNVASQETGGTVSTKAPPIPVGLSVSQSGTAPNIYPYLSWYQSNGAQGYKIYRQDPIAGTYMFINSTDQYTLYFQDTTQLTGGVNYYYKVQAWNAYGESNLDATDAISYYAPMSGTDLSAPYVFANGNDGKNWVQINWYSVYGASTYSIDYSTDEVNWAPAMNGTGISYTSYYFQGPTGTGMTTGQTYWFRVTAYDTTGHSAVSTAFSYAPPSGNTVPVTIKPY